MRRLLSKFGFIRSVENDRRRLPSQPSEEYNRRAEDKRYFEEEREKKELQHRLHYLELEAEIMARRTLPRRGSW